MLGAAAAASWKLLLVCMGVGWLLNRGHLPPDTAPVLSKVPCLPGRQQVELLPQCAGKPPCRAARPLRDI